MSINDKRQMELDRGIWMLNHQIECVEDLKKLWTLFPKSPRERYL